MERPVSVLLVEDDPAAVRLVSEALRDVAGTRFLVDRVDRLGSALEWLRRRSPGVVLLDLNLPDSRGLDTLIVLRTHAPRTAVVVFTSEPEREGVRALQAGAQDFLPKDRFDPDLLGRVLRYAVERQILLNEVQGRRSARLHEEDLALLGTVADDGPVRHQFFPGAPLRAASPDLFASLTRRYAGALAAMAAGEASGWEPVEDLARRLGVLNAGPGDAQDLHAAAYAELLASMTVAEQERFEGVARQALVELLGALVTHYRHYIVDLRGVTA